VLAAPSRSLQPQALKMEPAKSRTKGLIGAEASVGLVGLRRIAQTKPTSRRRILIEDWSSAGRIQFPFVGRDRM
jgi:hypothetical protein